MKKSNWIILATICWLTVLAGCNGDSSNGSAAANICTMDAECGVGQSCLGGVCQATPMCGNNVTEFGEICDGTDLAGETCVSQGFAGGGTLSCSGTCDAFVTTLCVP